MKQINHNKTKMNDLDKTILKKAKSKPVTIVIAEGWDERVLEAVHDIVKEKICNIILLGDEQEIADNVNKLKLDVQETKIINPNNYKDTDKLIKELVKLRKHKGMTEEKAKKLIKDVNYFACMLVHQGLADGVCSSCICPTADLMRPAFQILGKKPGYSLVNEVSIFTDPKNNRLIFFSDGSLNIDPTAEDLAQIALNTAECVQNLDIEPKVALLSFSTHGSGGSHPALDKVLEALKLAKKRSPKLKIDGELQADAALNPDSAKRKCKTNVLKGQANTLIFPDLMSANCTVHSLLQFSDMEIIYSFLVGIRKPVVIYGRSSPSETIKKLTIVCAMQANSK
jgi:phosphate acetyltransferase